MAQQVMQLECDKLSCSICLDLLKDPVTIPCGHSYCMSCIKDCWDADEGETHSCPQCRQSFTPRPVLVKNTMFTEVVEELKKVGVAAALPDHFYAGPEDVACDFCTGRRLKASKSCLVCVASYCEQHLQPHKDVAPLRKHKLVDATSKLQDSICSLHDEVMKVYCRTDQKCICYLCSMGDHKGHNTVPAATERAERQAELAENRQIFQQRIQDGEKNEEMLQKEEETISLSADRAAEDCEKMFKELISLIEKKSSEVTQTIRFLQTAGLCLVKERQKKLQQEIAELKQKDAELEQLSSIEDHLHFLHSYSSLSPPSASTASPAASISEKHFEEVTQAVMTTTGKIKTALSEEQEKSPQKATQEDVQEPKTRHQFLKYARQLSLDPITANEFLALSVNNRRATKEDETTVHPETFQKWWQVLGSEGLTGRCFWEVKWKGEVFIAVAYKDISRTGNVSQCGFGHNNKSWALRCDSSGYKFRHNNVTTLLSGPVSSRVAVFLDHSAGLLSFYSVTDTMNHLVKVQTTFTQPLYPGFWILNDGDYAELQWSAGNRRV